MADLDKVAAGQARTVILLHPEHSQVTLMGSRCMMTTGHELRMLACMQGMYLLEFGSGQKLAAVWPGDDPRHAALHIDANFALQDADKKEVAAILGVQAARAGSVHLGLKGLGVFRV